MQFITANHKELNVTFVNPSTKAAQGYIQRYIKTQRGSSIYDAYKQPSYRKVYAYNEIRKEMGEVNGWNIKITGAGSDIFSCAYKVKDEKDNEYLIYHTPSNRFAIQLN